MYVRYFEWGNTRSNIQVFKFIFNRKILRNEKTRVFEYRTCIMYLAFDVAHHVPESGAHIPVHVVTVRKGPAWRNEGRTTFALQTSGAAVPLTIEGRYTVYTHSSIIGSVRGSIDQ